MLWFLIFLRLSAAHAEGAYPKALPTQALSLFAQGNRLEALQLLQNTLDAPDGIAAPERESLRLMRRQMSRVFYRNETFQLYQRGLNFLYTAKFGAAQEPFVRANHDEPHHLEVLLRLGQAEHLTGQTRLALEHLQQAWHLDPDEPVVSLWLGRVWLDLKDYPQALLALERAHTGLPQSETTSALRARVWAEQGQWDAAIRALGEDLKAYPFHRQNRWRAAMYKMRTPMDAGAPQRVVPAAFSTSSIGNYGALDRVHQLRRVRALWQSALLDLELLKKEPSVEPSYDPGEIELNLEVCEAPAELAPSLPEIQRQIRALERKLSQLPVLPQGAD